MVGSLGRVELKPPEDMDVIKQRLNIMNDAIAAVSSRGMTMVLKTPADFQGDMPPDLTSLSDRVLGDLLGKFSEYGAFSDEQLALSRGERDVAAAVLESLSARVRLGLRDSPDSKKLTIKDKDDLVLTHPDIVEARARALYTEAVYSLIRSISNKVQRNWDTVSRRITQRGQEGDRNIRNTSVENIPAPGSRFRRG